jgi:hypothetical protein
MKIGMQSSGLVRIYLHEQASYIIGSGTDFDVHCMGCLFKTGTFIQSATPMQNCWTFSRIAQLFSPQSSQTNPEDPANIPSPVERTLGPAASDDPASDAVRTIAVYLDH